MNRPGYSGAGKREAPPREFVRGGASFYMEHETRFERIGSTASATASLPAAPPTNRSLIARSSSSRWQGDAGVHFIEEFRPDRSYRVVSINSGGRTSRTLVFRQPLASKRASPPLEAECDRSKYVIARKTPLRMELM